MAARTGRVWLETSLRDALEASLRDSRSERMVPNTCDPDSDVYLFSRLR
jgi:hypothetical protein